MLGEVAKSWPETKCYSLHGTTLHGEIMGNMTQRENMEFLYLPFGKDSRDDQMQSWLHDQTAAGGYILVAVEGISVVVY